MPKTSARLLARLSLLQTRRDRSGLADRLDISVSILVLDQPRRHRRTPLAAAGD